MNIEQANNLDFPDLLSRLGYEPIEIKQGGRDLWYLSPFRAETSPSFHIRPGEKYPWVWKDFGDEGGALISFATKYFNCTKKDALQYLRDMGIRPASGVGGYTRPTGNLFSSLTQSLPAQPVKIFSEPEKAESVLEFIKASPLQSPMILKYLQSRRISSTIASKYFYLIQYRNKNKPRIRPYFGFGMKNESGGYEIRSASDESGQIFKSAFQRDISFVKGSERSRGEVNIFEGQMDFVSMLEILNVDQLRGDSIVMHSTDGGFNKTMAKVRDQGYTRIHTFLDNDKSGQKFTGKFKEELGLSHTSWSGSFMPHKDLNKALKEGLIPSFREKPKEPGL